MIGFVYDLIPIDYPHFVPEGRSTPSGIGLFIFWQPATSFLPTPPTPHGV